MHTSGPDGSDGSGDASARGCEAAGAAFVPDAAAIADHVATWRRLLGWKQESLASFAGVSLSTVERIERAERVGAESLERVAEALGFRPGAFVEPRRRLTEAEAAARVGAMFAGRVEVRCRPFATQHDAQMLLDCEHTLLLGEGFDPEAAGLVEALRENLEGYSWLVGNMVHRRRPPRRREVYAALLREVSDIGRRGWIALCGTYTAEARGRDVSVAALAFFSRLSDPGAAKRRVLWVPKQLPIP
jgi:transcriptional regulator with XRE-family HTH domain